MAKYKAYHIMRGGRCYGETASGKMVQVKSSECGLRPKMRGGKKACVPGSARYVKGGACFCTTKGGGGKFIDKSICKRKYKK